MKPAEWQREKVCQLTGAFAQQVPIHPIMEPAKTKMTARPLPIRIHSQIASIALIQEQSSTEIENISLHFSLENRFV